MRDNVNETIINGDVVMVVEPLRLRPEVRKFAEAMERKLRENEGKGSWKDCELEYLRKRVHQEVDEFIGSLGGGIDVLGEAADVANFLMMICDVSSHLKIMICDVEGHLK